MRTATESVSAGRALQTMRRATLIVAAMAIGFAPVVASQEAASERTVRGISYVGATVTDLDASTRFYTEAAQLEEVARGRLSELEVLDEIAGRAQVSAETRLLASSNAQLRLMQFATKSEAGDVPVHGPGFAHLCYRADGANGTYQRFLERGARPLGSPEMVELSPRIPVLYAYVRDADGILFEVEHFDLDKIPTNAPPAGYHHIRHISLGSPDIERAVGFYSTLLEIPSPRRGGGEEGFSGEPFDQVSGLPGTRIKMAWFQVGNLELEVIQYLSHPTTTPTEPRPLDAPGYNMVVFDVASTAAARERLIEAGGRVVAEARPMDGGEILFGRDPDGNLLGFFVAPDGSPLSPARFSTSTR